MLLLPCPSSTVVDHLCYTTAVRLLQQMLEYDMYCKTCVVPLPLHDSDSAATSLLQYYYWLSTVSQNHQYNTRVPLLQHYGYNVLLRLFERHHYSTTVPYNNTTAMLRYNGVGIYLPTTVQYYTRCRQ
eukprot:6157657-Pyramimonas_sp.AAC.1